MSRRGTKRKNWVTLLVLLLVLLAALAVIVMEFASPATRGRLHGWLPTGQSSATQETRPQGR